MNYNNFARPESSLCNHSEADFDHEFANEQPLPNTEPKAEGYPCQECGELCDGQFCSERCYDDAHTGAGGIEPDEDGCPEEMEFEDDGQPTMYEEYQDLYGGDDWDHGQYDSEY